MTTPESTYDAAVIAAIGQTIREQALTAAEMDAMPDGSRVLDFEGDAWTKSGEGWRPDVGWGCWSAAHVIENFAPLTPTTSTTGDPR